MKKRDCVRCATPTRAALRVKHQIARYLENPGVKSPRLADALKAQENKPMATRAQIAAARRNIKKAQAARRHKRRGGRRRAATSNANPHKRRHAKRRRYEANRGRYEENKKRRRRHKGRSKRRQAAALNENPVNVSSRTPGRASLNAMRKQLSLVTGAASESMPRSGVPHGVEAGSAARRASTAARRRASSRAA